MKTINTDEAVYQVGEPKVIDTREVIKIPVKPFKAAKALLKVGYDLLDTRGALLALGIVGYDEALDIAKAAQADSEAQVAYGHKIRTRYIARGQEGFKCIELKEGEPNPEGINFNRGFPTVRAIVWLDKELKQDGWTTDFLSNPRVKK